MSNLTRAPQLLHKSCLLACIWKIYYCKFERFTKNALTRKMFFFFKWVRISPEIDWYHYQFASPAPTCIVRHQTMTKTPTRWSVTSEPSVPPPPWLRNIFTKLIQNFDNSKKSDVRNVQDGWIICSPMYFDYTYKYASVNLNCHI